MIDFRDWTTRARKQGFWKLCEVIMQVSMSREPRLGDYKLRNYDSFRIMCVEHLSRRID